MADTTAMPAPGDSGLAMRTHNDRDRARRPRRPAAPEAPDEASATDPDLGLLNQIRAGDRAALGELLTGYQDRLFCVCLNVVRDRELAGDLTQDAMVKIIGGLDQFNGKSKLSTWMIRVTVNVCLTHLRKQRLRRHASLDAPSGSSLSGAGRDRASDDGGRPIADALADAREPEAEGRVGDQEQLSRLQAALERLDPEQRTILILRDMQDLDYRLIGELLEIPQGTVKSRLFRARVALREQIERTPGEADG